MPDKDSSRSSSDAIRTRVVQISNISPSASREQLHQMFSYLGRIDEMKVYPSETNPIFGTTLSKLCYVKFDDTEAVATAQHLTNTPLIDRAIICVPVPEDRIPDEETALRIGGPALPGQRVLPSHVVNQIQTVVGQQAMVTVDPTLAQLGVPAYPPLPSNIDAVKLEEIRRTVYVGNIPKDASTDEILEFFNKEIGEVMYMRFAGGDDLPARYLYVEFTNQVTVPIALQKNGIEFKGSNLKIQHATQAVVKPRAKTEAMAKQEVEDAMRRAEASGPLSKALGGVDADEAVRRYGSKGSLDSAAMRAVSSMTRSRSPSWGRRSRGRSSRSRSPRRRISRSPSPRSRRRSPRRTRSPSPRRRSRDRDRGGRRRSPSRDRDRDRRRRTRSPSPSARRRSRDRDRDRNERDRDRNRDRDRDRDRERERDKDKEKEREREKEKDKRDKDRKDKDRESKDVKKESTSAKDKDRSESSKSKSDRSAKQEEADSSKADSKTEESQKPDATKSKSSSSAKEASESDRSAESPSQKRVKRELSPAVEPDRLQVSSPKRSKASPRHAESKQPESVSPKPTNMFADTSKREEISDEDDADLTRLRRELIGEDEKAPSSKTKEEKASRKKEKRKKEKKEKKKKRDRSGKKKKAAKVKNEGSASEDEGVSSSSSE